MKKILKLCYPVFTLDRKELLPAGTCLTPETMEELARSARAEKFATMRLMEYGTVAEDLRSYVEQPPYNQIFSKPIRTKAVFDSLRQIEFVQPLLDIYGYFKTHDPYTYRHILTVFALSQLLAQDLFKDSKALSRELLAASSHDFGKACMPLTICNKSTPLNDLEREQLSNHTAAGYVLLSYFLMDPNHPAAITARDHHERCDGSGYPRGIALQDRNVEIVAVSDVFDALISPRPYRPISYDLRTALEEVTVLAVKGAISTDVVRSLISCNRKDQLPYTDCTLSYEQRGTPPPGNLYRGVTPCQYCPDSDPEENRNHEISGKNIKEHD
ncbi:MAG: HD domain-containing protein [Geobacteraceae bacterium]|nr:HD domain-containing protein [Geobacteraceae bacterium]NTW80109.1 HD domain-containing protein [Geobacteraceae bacterium]